MRPARFERATPGFVDRYSIQLSYGRIVLTKHLLIKKQRHNEVSNQSMLASTVIASIKRFQKPQMNKKFNNGEADGTRTRNIQIDSLVL
jgi:hypothetical protein